MPRRISALCGIILCCGLAHGVAIQRYEHWIDNDVSNKVIVKSSAEDLAISIDLQKITEGVHYFNFRVQDSEKKWGELNRYLFFIPSRQDANTKLSNYEYWIDNNISDKIIKKSDVTEVAINYDISNLSEGVHFFNFRSCNGDGIWGGLERYLFYIPSKENPSVILASYEYWIDNDVNSKKAVKTSESEVAISCDVSAISEGVHFFNFRSCNSDGIWGGLERYLFYIPSKENPSAKLASYEYWIDNDVNSKKAVKTSESEVAISCDVSAISEGVHFFNFRSCNSDGIWGGLERFLFYVPSKDNVASKLSSCEYWIDDDVDAKTTVKQASEDKIITIDVKDLSNGVHYFNYRACNSNGVWGALNRFLFFKTNETYSEPTPITGYEYCFGALKETVDITPTSNFEVNDMVLPIPPLAECSPIDNTCRFTMSKDSVVMNRNASLLFSMRFRNENGQWSAPLVEKINMSDAIGHKPDELGLQKSIEFKKVTAGDYHPFYVNVAETGSYYFKASQPCTIDLYKSDGTLFKTMSEEELLKIKQLGLFEGMYYGIVHNTRTDSNYPASTIIVRMLLTEGYVPTPVINYSNGKATITCEQEGAKIYYTTDGSDPTTKSKIYTSAIDVNTNITIKAMATYEDLSPSDIAVYKVDVFKVANPVIEFANLKLYMTCSTSNSSIFYTLDGTDPIANGTKYTGPISVSKSCTAKAVAKREGYNNSDVVTYVFDDSSVTCATPTIDFANGDVTINCIQDGAKIYYTTDGSAPTTSSTLYKGTFKVDNNCTIRAIATCDGFLNSAIAEYKIDSFKVTTPIIQFANLQVHITCATAKAEIYYTLDGTNPDEKSTRYTGPISIQKSMTVKAFAKRADYYDSDIATYNVDVDGYTCPKPIFTLIENTLKIECLESGSKIHYTMDGSTPTSSSSVYTSPIKLEHNCTVKAYAEKSGYLNSEVAIYTVDWIKADAPTFKLDGKKLSIASSTQGASIYFTIGGEIPNESSLKYSAPITLTDNKVIKAIAVADNYNTSNVAEYKPDIFVCSSVNIKYNGRYISLETQENGATIHYTVDGTAPSESSMIYSSPIDINGLVTVKAIATNDYFVNSNTTSFSATHYYDGEHAQTSEIGVLNKAFEWCDANEIETLKVSGNINDIDLKYLASMSSLNHLDLENAETPEGHLPDKAFANSAIVSISMPKTIGNVGARLFDGCNKIAAIQWNATKPLPASAMEGINNPNLLLYVKINSLAPSNIKNIIASDVAESIVLSDASGNNDFYCPREFTAKSISYKHTYMMKTEIDACGGWETLALPFDVQTITHSKNGEISPFAAHDESTKQFWLYSLGDYGFEKANRIEANVPYIISMPNHDEYDDNYILAGDVTFSSKNVTVPITTHNISSKGDFMFIPTTKAIERGMNVYVINKNEEHNGHKPGSMFVGDLRDVSPFEGYLAIESQSRPSMIRLSDIGFDYDDISGIDIPRKYTDMKICIVAGRLYIESTSERNVNVYSINGTLVRSVDLHIGVNVIDGLYEGTYIIGNKSIYVK